MRIRPRPAGGTLRLPPLTRDDLLDLHLVIDGTTWFQEHERSTPRQQRRPLWLDARRPKTALDMDRASEAAPQLQPLLTDLVGLSLIGKQAHWTVVGTEFPQVHEQFDVVVELARTAADRFAERIVALGAIPDGQPQTVATTLVAALPLEWQPTRDAVAAIADTEYTKYTPERSPRRKYDLPQKCRSRRFPPGFEVEVIEFEPTAPSLRNKAP